MQDTLLENARAAFKRGQPREVIRLLHEEHSANVHYRIGLVSLLIQLNRDEETIQALGGLDASQIETARCATCLSRIAALFRRTQRHALAEICDDRVTVLKQPEPSVDDKTGFKMGGER